MQEENAQESGSIRMQWKKLNTEKKLAIIALVIGAGFIFVFSALRVRQGIYSPFLASIDDFEKNRELIQDPIAEYESLQKRTDTDGDGLSDWAEENIYKTSPYLWSTAGDDVPDNVKIAMGENPLCKSGETCDIGAMKFNLPTTTLPTNISDMQDPSTRLNDVLMGTGPGSSNYQETVEDMGIDIETMKEQIPKDPAVLRSVILQTGKITQEDLEKISDDDLMKLMNDALIELETEMETEKQANQ
ncbi:MAG: hypothetical protein P1P90_01540 [Patescibacteria group bacterium]|nr:hypothetical protein [Patescibacteria group bacterium]